MPLNNLAVNLVRRRIASMKRVSLEGGLVSLFKSSSIDPNFVLLSLLHHPVMAEFRSFRLTDPNWHAKIIKEGRKQWKARKLTEFCCSVFTSDDYTCEFLSFYDPYTRYSEDSGRKSSKSQHFGAKNISHVEWFKF